MIYFFIRKLKNNLLKKVKISGDFAGLFKKELGFFLTLLLKNLF